MIVTFVRYSTIGQHEQHVKRKSFDYKLVTMSAWTGPRKRPIQEKLYAQCAINK